MPDIGLPSTTAPVRVIENIWIPMSDGCRLAARLWLPGSAEATPVPALLEYIPYRKRDGTRGRDEPMHGWFAANGYAVLRVDLRGSGESDGHMADEYLAQELEDGAEVIAWIAAQPWCSGAVGMMGKSWGGFNALQVAALRPPALKAIVTVCSTDDRYADDVHYMGGCVLNDNLWWGSIMMAYQSRPADPAIVGDAWRAQWLDRLERLPFFPGLWLEHQRRDDYWRHGSVCEDWDAIQCPVFAVGGWADAYSNAIPRLLEHLRVPRLGLIGPWAHVYPQDGAPGPAIGFLQEALRWWDQWLKGADTGIMDEPMLRAYVQDWTPPFGVPATAPGRWVGEKTWPSPAIAPRRLHLHAGGALRDGPGAERMIDVRSPLSHGQACGDWMASGGEGELPTDQRLDDGSAVLFDTEPLTEPLDILGAPVAEFELAADRPVAQLCVRLCDVAPDGGSTRVSYGILNLTHRDSHAAPEPLVPGQRYKVRLKLNDCGHRFAAGHRLRVAVATSYWPIAWPAPFHATLSLAAGTSCVVLPVRGTPEAEADVRFEPPVAGRPAPATRLAPGVARRTSTQDHVTGEITYVAEGVGGGPLRYEETGTELSHELRREMSIRPDDPLSARFVVTQDYAMGREGWRIGIRTRAEMRCTETEFLLDGEVTATENGRTVATRRWTRALPRDLV